MPTVILMIFFLLLILFIINFLLVLDQLTIFLIVFLSIQQIVKIKKSKEAYFYKLNKIFKNTLIDSSTIVIILDTSIKNNITTFISHIYSSLNNIKKTIHYTVNITLTETKLFAIRYKINQAVQISGVSYIIVITSFIYLARHIFDSITYSCQIQSIAIVQDLRVFSNKNTQNSINFWDYSRNAKQSYYISVDKETKKFNLTFILLYKMSQNYSKKEEYNNIIKNQQITFQISNLKENYFSEILDDNYFLIVSTYTKEGWQIN